MGALKLLTQVNVFKTLYANLKLLPLKKALHFPIVVGNHVKLELKGKVLLDKVKPGIVSIGIGGSNDLRYFRSRRSYFGIKRGGILHFKGKAHFAVHSSVLVSGATMEVGHNFSCNNGTKISCIEGISFGDKCLLGTNVLVMDSDGHTVFTGGVAHPNKKNIIIGNHVWLTSQVSVLKGVTIADDVVVGFGSIVTKSIAEANTICAGSPAKVVKQGITWER